MINLTPNRAQAGPPTALQLAKKRLREIAAARQIPRGAAMNILIGEDSDLVLRATGELALQRRRICLGGVWTEVGQGTGRRVADDLVQVLCADDEEQGGHP